MRNSAVSTATAFSLFLLSAVAVAHAELPGSCDLLSTKMATVLAGGPVADPMDAGFLCLYASDSVRSQVTLTVSRATKSDDDKYMKANGGAVTGDTYESIPGLGSPNLFIARADNKHSLIVFYHGKEVFLLVHRKMTPELKVAMIQAMKQILAKL